LRALGYLVSEVDSEVLVGINMNGDEIMSFAHKLRYSQMLKLVNKVRGI